MHTSDFIFPSPVRSFTGERVTGVDSYSCHLEHLASRSLLGRIKHRMVCQYSIAERIKAESLFNAKVLLC